MNRRIVSLTWCAVMVLLLGIVPIYGMQQVDEVLLDDFEAYEEGALPTRWQHLRDRRLLPVSPEVMSDQELFVIKEEAGNKFVRAIVDDQAHRIMMANGDRFDWDIRAHPWLQWDWRAVQLPEGAREDEKRKNDVGAAVLVFFDRDWLGRPRSIKYTYSSTLPVGTEVSYGVLKVVVVSSGADSTGGWHTIERNVAEDYERLFDRTPPERPLSIALWSDSDNTKSVVKADFDNIRLLPGSTSGR